MPYQLYWGDLHNHCSISYGHGSVEQTLARARQQLDFCSITGHAFWPDMPTDRARYADIIDYHNLGFARLARNWDQLLARQAAATAPGHFIALPSYEWQRLCGRSHHGQKSRDEKKRRESAQRHRGPPEGAFQKPPSGEGGVRRHDTMPIDQLNWLEILPLFGTRPSKHRNVRLGSLHRRQPYCAN